MSKNTVIILCKKTTWILLLLPPSLSEKKSKSRLMDVPQVNYVEAIEWKLSHPHTLPVLLNA